MANGDSSKKSNNLKFSAPKLPIPGLNQKSSSSKKQPQNKMMAFLKGFAVYILIALAALVFFAGLSGGYESGTDIPISQAVNEIREGKIEKVTVEGDKIKLEYKEQGKTAQAHKEPGESIYQILESSGVDPKSATINVQDVSWQNAWIGILGTLLPIIIMIVFFLLIFRQARDAGSGIFSFGQSRARLFSKDAPQIKSFKKSSTF